MGLEPSSFIQQLGPDGGYQFSYCLQNHDDYEGNYTPMFLSFGSYITRPSVMYTTPLLPVRGTQLQYYVNLIDISVAGTHLNIPQYSFGIGAFGARVGVAIDSGTTFSHLIHGAYDILQGAIMAYISRHNNHLVRHPYRVFSLETCWASLGDSADVDLPQVTFHFDGGADLIVRQSEMFTILHPEGDAIIICLAVVRSPFGFNVIGAYQQIDQRMIFDVMHSRVSFGPQDCSSA
ncbi:hypothetical protein vseg_010820 [Gypsophila vaccaria]